MAVVSLPIGGRTYDVRCRAGGEEALKALGLLVDEKVQQATASAGPTDEVRRLLFASLLLAEESSKAAVVPQQPEPRETLDIDAVASAVERLAARVEKLADALEQPATDA